MEIKADESTKILGEQVGGYEAGVDVSEVGRVVAAGDGIARVYGLEGVMYGELVELPHEVFGLALNLEEESVSLVLFGETTHIKEGDTAKRTGRILDVPVGDALIGRVVDALGRPGDGKGAVLTKESNPTERGAAGGGGRPPGKGALATGRQG